jgi:hypothetical protein
MMEGVQSEEEDMCGTDGGPVNGEDEFFENPNTFLNCNIGDLGFEDLEEVETFIKMASYSCLYLHTVGGGKNGLWDMF